jgi:hypothetical protein
MQENLDLVGVQETIKQDFSDKELREWRVRLTSSGNGFQLEVILGGFF